MERVDKNYNKKNLFVGCIVFGVLFLFMGYLILNYENSYIIREFQYPNIEINFKSTNIHEQLIIFYNNQQDDVFDEQHIERHEIYPLQQYQTVISKIPYIGLKNIRIDFGNTSGKTQIESVIIRKNLFEEKRMEGEELQLYFPNGYEINLYQVENYIDKDGNFKDYVNISYDGTGFIDPRIHSINLLEIQYDKDTMGGIFKILEGLVICLVTSGLIFSLIIFLTNLIIFLTNKMKQINLKYIIQNYSNMCKGFKNIRQNNKLFNEISILKKIKESGFHKKRADLVNFILFLSVRTYLLFYYKGYYAFDEFYHIADNNLEFISEYKRATYINKIVRLISHLIEEEYFAVKIIPYFISLISFTIIIYMVKKICNRISSIYIAGLLMTFHSLIIFNHLYVRMYIFEELVISLGILLLYNIGQYKRHNIKQIIFIILYITIIGMYCIFTKDDSRYALLGTGVLAIIVTINREKVIKILSGKIILIILLALFVIFEAIVIGIKANMIDFSSWPLAENINLMLKTFYVADSPVLLEYFLTKGVIWLLFMGFTFFIIIKEKQYNLIGVWILVEIPLIAYLCLFYESEMLRTFTPYLVGQIIIVSWGIERIVEKYNIQKLCISLVLFTILFSYPKGNCVAFYNKPFIPNETYLTDYSSLKEEIDYAEKNNTKVITIFKMVQQEIFFDIEPTASYTIVDDNNVKRDISDQAYKELINMLLSTNEKYILAIVQGGTDKLNELDLLSRLTKDVQYKKFNDYQYIFYFNTSLEE